MIEFLVKRTVHSLISLIGLLVLVFFLTRLTGDPAYLYLPLNAPLAAREAFSKLHGYDAPIYVQLFRYFGDLLRLDFGRSLRLDLPAMQIALEAFPRTLSLAVAALSFSSVLAVTVGCLAAINPTGLIDKIFSTFSLIGSSAPDFWVAIVGILIFSIGLDLLPTSGTGSVAHWVLPVLVLSLRPFGLLAQIVRGSMISVLASPYIKTAFAKGVGFRRIVIRHALRNASLPAITVLGDLAASLINGAVVVETIFGWPGIGKLMIDAINQRDFAVVQSTILVTALAVFVLNIVIDVIYTVVDPRIRY